jgi:hypothetical protein
VVPCAEAGRTERGLIVLNDSLLMEQSRRFSGEKKHSFFGLSSSRTPSITAIVQNTPLDSAEE